MSFPCAAEVQRRGKTADGVGRGNGCLVDASKQRARFANAHGCAVPTGAIARGRAMKMPSRINRPRREPVIAETCSLTQHQPAERGSRDRLEKNDKRGKGRRQRAERKCKKTLPADLDDERKCDQRRKAFR